MLFGGKKNLERTLLVLDVENGSVGSALARLSPGKQPRIFGEARAYTTLALRVTGALLAKEIERVVSAVIRNAALVTARVRLHPKTVSLGEVDSIVVFLAPPWGTPNLSLGKPDFMPEMSEYLIDELASAFEDVPVSFYTAAAAAAFGAQELFSNDKCLVCNITGEMSEVMRIDGGGVRAYATIPTGLHGILRTLCTHGGLSEAEAHSILHLAKYSEQGTYPSTTLGSFDESLHAAASNFSRYFKDTVKEMLSPGDVLRVRIIAHEPVCEWFARALSIDSALAELFPEGGEVRPIKSHHLTPYIETHAATPDLALMLGALFVNSHFNN